MFPPADASKPLYDLVIVRWLHRGTILRSHLNICVTSDQRSRVCTFGEYMRTGFLTVARGRDPAALGLFARLMNRETLRKVLRKWRDCATDLAAVRRLPEKIATIARFRHRLVPEFWTFHFWQFWNRFQRIGSFKILIDSHLYLPEWVFSRAKIICRCWLIFYANNLRGINLLRNGIRGLYASFVKLNRLNRAYANCVGFFSRALMKTSVLAMRQCAMVEKFNTQIRRRILREWYSSSIIASCEASPLKC
jgi:hypothetical protein